MYITLLDFDNLMQLVVWTLGGEGNSSVGSPQAFNVTHRDGVCFRVPPLLSRFKSKRGKEFRARRRAAIERTPLAEPTPSSNLPPLGNIGNPREMDEKNTKAFNQAK